MSWLPRSRRPAARAAGAIRAWPGARPAARLGARPARPAAWLGARPGARPVWSAARLGRALAAAAAALLALALAGCDGGPIGQATAASNGTDFVAGGSGATLFPAGSRTAATGFTGAGWSC